MPHNRYSKSCYRPSRIPRIVKLVFSLVLQQTLMLLLSCYYSCKNNPEKISLYYSICFSLFHQRYPKNPIMASGIIIRYMMPPFMPLPACSPCCIDVLAQMEHCAPTGSTKTVITRIPTIMINPNFFIKKYNSANLRGNGRIGWVRDGNPRNRIEN